MNLRQLILRRSLNAFITILLIMVVNFILFRMMPSDPAILFTPRGAHVNPDFVEINRRYFGLDKPLYEQFFIYMGNTLIGRWGYSYDIQTRLVLDLVMEKLSWTLLLVGTTTVITIFVGILIGVWSAYKRGKPFDIASTGVGIFFYSIPTFFFGILLGLIFARWFPLLPAGGVIDIEFAPIWPLNIDKVVNIFYHMILPSITLTIGYLAGISLIMRGSLTDVLTEDYITTARAKGLTDRQMLRRHARPNAMLPMVSLVALNFAFVIGGAYQTEVVFNYDGIGLLTIKAVDASDFPVLQAIFFIGGVAVVLANLIADFVTYYLDPRIKIS